MRNPVQILKGECNPSSSEPVLFFFSACYISPNYSFKQREKSREEMPVVTERRQDTQKVADDTKSIELSPGSLRLVFTPINHKDYFFFCKIYSLNTNY